MAGFKEAVQRGTRAGQPAASGVIVGTLYYVTDEEVTERSNGTSWQSYSGTGTSIANDAVTYAKMQNVSAASKLLGRGSAAGAGDPEEITVGSGLSMSGTTLSASGGGSGKVAQVVNTQTGAVATTTTLIPFDDTIPQNTEGAQFMSLAITPTSATNKLKIEVVIQLSNSVANWYVAALFQDSTANALAAITAHSNLAGGGVALTFTHYMTSGTTSATTFKVRAGCHFAGTTTFNGNSSARIFGGVMASSITITEIVP